MRPLCFSAAVLLLCLFPEGGLGRHLLSLHGHTRNGTATSTSDELPVKHIHGNNNECPCDNPSLCAPISDQPPIQAPEVYGFIGCWKGGDDPCMTNMNWTHVTTVAWADADEVMCEAHRHGARAIIGSPPIANLTELAVNPQLQRLWVAQTLSQVVSRHRDGVVFDYEEPMERHSIEAQAYVSLINLTRTTLQRHNPHYQVTVCVGWSPDGIDGRDYPYAQLASVSDALYVMDYDTRSQINDDCIASANAPIGGTRWGIQRYLALEGITPSQLILGVPWYGYRYPCLPGTQLGDRYCPIKPYDFRGSVCSDAVGSELPYLKILERHARSETTTSIRRDHNMDAAYFNDVEEERDDNNSTRRVVVQYWFDDSLSTRHKYEYARSMGLAGVGPYRFDQIGYPGAFRQEAQDMWAALDAFVLPQPQQEDDQ